MGELDLCSRREADRWIRAGTVWVDGQLAQVGQQVPHDLASASIVLQPQQQQQPQTGGIVPGIVLHKPRGYVSGQAEHGHRPAIQLLTANRRYFGKHKSDEKKEEAILSRKGLVPTGRLDRDSTGLLIFCSSGVLAKKLLTSVDKEYIVDVVPAEQVSKRERELNPDFSLPTPTQDLTPLIRGGQTLLGDFRKLQPCRAHWLQPGEQLRITLQEGRNRQIRRACRELLGYHVNGVHRTRVGPIDMADLPVGKWRPLEQDEIEDLLKVS